MGTRIILLSDGTGNAASKVWRTNVWRVFESLDLTGSDQVANYDDGVGTSSFKPLAILGGAFGSGGSSETFSTSTNLLVATTARAKTKSSASASAEALSPSALSSA